nr:NAD(P)-dependent oxidoreductase [uncultured Oscillibacter sp.]
MRVVIIGHFPEISKRKIVDSFPRGWEICIVPPEEADRYLADAEVVIPEHVQVDGAFLDKAPKLRLVQTGAGFDNVDIASCTGRGVRVCNAAGINAAAVAEHVMAFMLCWYKNIHRLDLFVKARGDERGLDYTGAELAGKTIGVIGLGAIGQRVARYCSAFDMRVLGYSRRSVRVPGVEPADLDSLYARSDVVTVHVPLNDATRHMIGRDVFARMKSTALLINTARGAIVDERQLIEALKRHEIGGACLDVYEEEPLARDHPLRDLPNVILTPHTAGLPDGVKFHERRYAFFVSNISKVMDGQVPENALNTF